MSYERWLKPFCVAGSLLGLIVLAALIPQLTLAKVPELCLFGIFFLSAGLSMTPIPKSRLYFMFGAPFAVLSILILKQLTVFPFVIAYFLSALYKSKTSRQTPFYISLWNALRFAPILWASCVVYYKIGGVDFHTLSQFRVIPFIGMAIVFEALRLFSFNAALAMHLGKSPWRLIVPFSAEIDLLFIPIAIPMYLFYQSAGVIGLLLLLLPVTIVLVFIKYLVEQTYKKQEALDAFNVVSELIDARLSLSALADRIFDKLTAILAPQAIELFTKNSLGSWKLKACKGESFWRDSEFSSKNFEAFIGELFLTDPMLFQDISKDKRFTLYHDHDFFSLLLVPFFSENKGGGLVILSHRISRFFDEGALELARMLVPQLRNALVAAQAHEELAATLKQLKETQAQLVQSEKMAGLGKMVAGVAHELNNPLGALSLSVSLLEEDVGRLRRLFDMVQAYEAIVPNEIQLRFMPLKERLSLRTTVDRLPDAFASLQEATFRSKAIIESLQTFAKTEAVEDNWDYVNLQEAIDNTLQILAPMHQGRIAIHKMYGEVPEVGCNATLINQVFMNVLVNAFEAVEGEGDVWITTSFADGRVSIVIEDSGKGVPPAIQTRIFEPFFTTKELGKGPGLGLSTAYSIVKQHHGEIRLESQEGRGATFKVILPAAAAVLA